MSCPSYHVPKISKAPCYKPMYSLPPNTTSCRTDDDCHNEQAKCALPGQFGLGYPYTIPCGDAYMDRPAVCLPIQTNSDGKVEKKCMLKGF